MLQKLLENNKFFLIAVIICSSLSAHCQIDLPTPLRFTCKRSGNNADIVYYFNAPSKQPKDFPIVVLCEGSSGEGDLESVMFMHQYFRSQIDALDCGIVTVEKWGIDGKTINEQEFWGHYTRSQRLHDHCDVINHLTSNPPARWDGTFVFFGISEGGQLVNDLSVMYPKIRATINWTGIGGDWGWADQLWEFLVQLRSNHWLLTWLYNCLPECLQLYGPFPDSREKYDKQIEYIRQHPLPDKRFTGMTYLWHVDALKQLPIDYTKIYAPMLVVMGQHDPNVASYDQFVKKAQEIGAPITYFRVEGMGHYIRKRPDIIEKSFDWLKQNLNTQECLNESEG